MKKLPTKEELSETFYYCPDTGDLYWKKSTGSVKENYAAGHLRTFNNGKTYTVVMLYRGFYLAHRLIYKLVTGLDPDGHIDHINGDGTDNRWENLRCVSQTENNRNAKRRVDNISGVTGISKHKGKWLVRISGIYVGVFDDFEQAVQARKVAEEKYGFHPNHGKR